MHDQEEIKQAVRDRYAGHAQKPERARQPVAAACCGGAASCGVGCGDDASAVATAVAGATAELGYSADELAAIPPGADLGLGCGNPTAMLELQPGETVLDLGSGAGIDCFIASGRVGPTGHVIGVDMTPEMLTRARRNAASGGYSNVEFRLGEVEHLPVADASVEAIISNCVINLVPDKPAVFSEAYRVLTPGGRLSVSDIVVLGEIPLQIRDSVDAYVACMSGAILRDEYLGMLADAGFTDIRVTEEHGYDIDDIASAEVIEEFAANSAAGQAELRAAAALFRSIRVQATKPASPSS